MKTRATATAALAALVAAGAFHFTANAGDGDVRALAKAVFGDNVRVFSPEDAPEDVAREVEETFRRQRYDQFGKSRKAFMFMPGDYVKAGTLNVGYYTQVLGLGRSPLDVRLANVKTPAALPANNATCNFWVGIENVSIVDTDGNDDPYFAFQWAVSQAAPARRLHVERKAVFDWFNGWASGGFAADCVFRKPAGSFSQQQYFYRNCRLEGGVYGINWNNVIEGCDGGFERESRDGAMPLSASRPLAGAEGRSNWSAGGCTTVIDRTPAIREKPFVFVEGGAFKVFVPAMRRGASGPSWTFSDPGPGETLDVVRDFHVAVAGRDDASSINAALAAGRNLILAPGIFHVSEPIRVDRPGTVVLGLGEATVIPENGEAAMVCADVDGLVVSGVVFDAGPHSRRFLVLGGGARGMRHRERPSVLHDIVCRVGGTTDLGRCDVCVEIGSGDAIVDQTWIWRADHGDNTGWNANVAENGLVVHGDGVECHGLFVEHFREYDVLWNGEDGRTVFLQNEKCYDPVSQRSWMSHGGRKRGWSAYKVADGVKRHYAAGLGVYDVLINTNGESVFLDDAVEVPDAPGVMVENTCIVEIASDTGPLVGFSHIVNGRGHGIRNGRDSGGGYAVQRLAFYCDGKAEELPDAYERKRR